MSGTWLYHTVAHRGLSDANSADQLLVRTISLYCMQRKHGRVLDSIFLNLALIMNITKVRKTLGLVVVWWTSGTCCEVEHSDRKPCKQVFLPVCPQMCRRRIFFSFLFFFFFCFVFLDCYDPHPCLYESVLSHGVLLLLRMLLTLSSWTLSQCLFIVRKQEVAKVSLAQLRATKLLAQNECQKAFQCSAGKIDTFQLEKSQCKSKKC